VDGRQGALTGLYLLCLSALEDSGTLLHLAELRVRLYWAGGNPDYAASAMHSLGEGLGVRGVADSEPVALAAQTRRRRPQL
jgi:hypothetical protein